jgi:HEAT repeat protein
MRGVWFWSALVALSCLPRLGAQWAAQQKRPTREPEWVTYDEAGVKVMIRYLKKERKEIVLVMCLDTLARMGAKAKPAVPAILETLEHPAWWVKVAAARALIDLGAETEKGFRTLTDALGDKDPDIRAGSARLIGDVVNPPFKFPSCWGPGPRPQTPRPALGKKAVPLLTAALTDRSPAVRSAAAGSLGRIGADARSAVPALLNALDDKELTVRKAAGDAAKRIVAEAAARAGVK